ncbi:MAG TPA: hypothetical protein VGJ26_19990 [Pirellulales bacterium]
MRVFYSLAAVALTMLGASVARAQDPVRAGVARAAENMDDRAREASGLEQDRLNLSTDPNQHLIANPNSARLDANARAAANLPRGNVNGNVGAGANAQITDPNRWRYVRHNDQWWYYTPNNTWMYHHNNAWRNYDAATYVHPRYSMGYRGYNNPYNNRRYNYAPGVRVQGTVNGGAAVNRTPATTVPNTIPPAAGIRARTNAAGEVIGSQTGEPIRDAAEKAEGVQPGDAGSAIGRP